MVSIDSVGKFFSPIFSQVFSKIVLAVIILMMGFVLGRILGKFFQKLLHEMSFNKGISRIFKTRLVVEQALGLLLTYFIYFIALVIALNQLGLTSTVLSVLAVAIIVLITVSAVLAAIDLVPNIVTGITIRRKHVFHEGDHVRFNEIEGKIICMNLTEVVIETEKKDILFIPNSILMKHEIVKLRKENNH